jgi:putative membrane protein insertion efficiency factor
MSAELEGGAVDAEPRVGAGRRIATAPIRAYRAVLSPLLGQRCKYHPSCSAYAVQAIEEQGVARGIVLAGWRLARCNPWSHGGVDYPADQRVFRR